MHIKKISSVLFMSALLILAACTAESPSLEPSAQENDILTGTEIGNALKEQEATAMPMPEAPEGIVAGEEEIVVEESNLENEPIAQPEGEPIAETAIDSREEPLVSGSGKAKLDLANKEGRIEYARQNLAEKLQVPLESVQQIDYKNVVWPDGNMGCPQKGKRFTPAEIPGYLIRLTVNNEVYEYHGGGGQLPSLCADQGSVQSSDKEIILPPPKVAP